MAGLVFPKMEAVWEGLANPALPVSLEFMKTRVWMTPIVLSLLVAATALGLFWTREPPPAPEQAAPAKKAGTPSRPRQVDQRPLQTARRLAALARTPEEQAFARQAVRLANHEIDLAFAEALRQAVEEAPPLSPEAKERLAEKTRAEAEVAEDQASIRQLSAQIAQASSRDRGGLEDRLEVAKAQLELNQDELEEAAENLEQAGGDLQARIRRLKASHEAADQEAPAQVPQAATGSGVLARFRAWNAERGKRAQLLQAQQDALGKVQRLSLRQEAVAKRLKEERDSRTSLKEQAKGVTALGGASADTLAALRRHTQDQRRLTSLVKRTQDQRALGEVYSAWAGVVAGHERIALNLLLKGLLTILLLVALAFVLSLGIDRLFHAKAEEDVREGTLRIVARFTVHLVAALTILFIVFGLPSQTTTILGLAGAGLTVALKDFIVAFFGWFVLMGRNGIRVGDWVEIRGVGGEVVEIGLLRTVLLETGNWSDSGHPTGRRVAFVNSFAMEGHFFNFSTTGQWMWDDLRVMILPGQDPYPIIEGVQKLVEERTRGDIAQAELEWQQATTRYRVRTFSATPGIQVVPTSFGIEIHVRYITRAFERHETRKALYQSVVDFMQGKGAAGASPGIAG